MGYNNALSGRFGQDILTNESWQAFIKAGRAKTIRTTANNTTARILDNGDVAIKLHNTDIVTVTTKDTYILNSGGWLTSTTKERINRYSPASISQKSGVWYMADKSLFYDLMEIDRDGQPLKPRATEEYEAELKKIKKQARAYAKDYVNALKHGLIDYPSGGDCWYCAMRQTGTDKPLGELTGDAAHIRHHIRDSYFVPSLLVNAGHAAGYRDHQIGMMGIGGQRLFIDPENVLYKYIVKQLQSELGGGK